MALTKTQYVITTSNETKTIVSNETGLIYNFNIYNDNDTANSVKIYIDDDPDVVLYNLTLESKQTLNFKPDILLNGETLKIYVEKDGINIVTQILKN